MKELGALRPQYAQLDNLNKELREELKNNALNHENILKSYQDLEKNLKEQLTKKDEKIDNLAAENKDLKSEIEALKYQLDLKEKSHAKDNESAIILILISPAIEPLGKT